jgi:pyruvate/2-oxoglutarate dehydrogenase complex dihydrolipoamide dehydrogenase (E3) component
VATTYDLVIIGMGSAGTLAAELAAGEMGLRVAAIERHRVGGDCLWTGCVPSKALVESARVARHVRRAGEFGIVVDEPTVDLDSVWRRIHAVRDGIAGTDDDPERFRSMGVELVTGSARVTGAREVTVDTGDATRRLSTRYVLVCTGSRPSVPAVPGLGEVEYLTSETLFDLDRPPSSLALIGGGPIGAELSQSLVRLGVPTTVFEAEPRLLPRDEPELADRLTTILRDEGVAIHLGTPATAVRRARGGIEVRSDDRSVTADAVFVAAGVRSNVESLGLEAFGIPVGPHGVTVDGRNRTLVPSIYVVGDAAANRPRFTHSAATDAALAVRDMFFPGRGLATELVPWCTFTDPELAHAGLTAAQARERYGTRAVEVHRHELAHNDRARAAATTEGAMIVVTAKKRIVGAHVLAPSAGEMIHELVTAIRFGLGLDDLAGVVHVYPTLATGIARLSADTAFRRARRYRGLVKLNRALG